MILTQALSAPPVSRVPTCSTSHHSPCRPWGCTWSQVWGQTVSQLPCKKAPSDRSCSWLGHLFSLMAAGSDSPFLSHSSWHCHTYLTALSPHCHFTKSFHRHLPGTEQFSLGGYFSFFLLSLLLDRKPSPVVLLQNVTCLWNCSPNLPPFFPHPAVLPDFKMAAQQTL